jgi:hypothetical protein
MMGGEGGDGFHGLLIVDCWQIVDWDWIWD